MSASDADLRRFCRTGAYTPCSGATAGCSESAVVDSPNSGCLDANTLQSNDHMLSFIIPAHNEEHWIAACVSSIRAAMQNIAEPYELIVVDDASTDATANIATELATGWLGSSETRAPSTAGTGLQSLRVLRVNLRKISAVRNAGARAATGDTLFFIDADTQANEPAIRAALAALEDGAAGGGCVPEF